MALGKKIFVVFLIVGIGFTIGGYTALNIAVFPTVKQFEKDSMTVTLSRVNQILEADLDMLQIKTLHYSTSDYTYAFAMGSDPVLTGERTDSLHWDDHALWSGNGIDMMLIFDARGKLLYSRLQNPTGDGQLQLQQEFLQPLVAGHPLVTHNSPAHNVAGLLKTRSGIIQVVANPVLTGDGNGPVAGSVVLAQFLTPVRVAEIGAVAAAGLSLHMVGTADPPPLNAAQIQESLGGPQSILFTFGHKSVQAFQSTADVFGTPIAVMEAYAPRRITRIGENTIRSLMTILAYVCALFILSAAFIMQRLTGRYEKALASPLQSVRSASDISMNTLTHGANNSGRSNNIFGLLNQPQRPLSNNLSHSSEEALISVEPNTNRGRVRNPDLPFRKPDAVIVPGGDGRGTNIRHNLTAKSSGQKFVSRVADITDATSHQGEDKSRRELDSPIDKSTINMLSKLQLPGAPNIIRRVFGIYLEFSGKTKNKLISAIEASNPAMIREAALALKSSSLNIGAIGLADICKQLEYMGRNNDISAGPLLLRRLEAEYARVVTALKTELGANSQ